VRMLGRTGVLSLNMLTTMTALNDVRPAARTLAQAVAFEQGSSYADFNPSTDKTAEYGLAGLVLGGGALAAAGKLGLFAVIAKFFKLILVGAIAVGGAVMAFFRRMFGRREKDI